MPSQPERMVTLRGTRRKCLYALCRTSRPDEAAASPHHVVSYSAGTCHQPPPATGVGMLVTPAALKNGS